MNRPIKIMGFLVACPAAALLGWCLGGLFLVNGATLILRAAQERGSIKAEGHVTDLLVSVTLALGTFCAGVLFSWTGRRMNPFSTTRPVLAYLLCVSVVVLLEDNLHAPFYSKAVVWAGFIIGGLTDLSRERKGPANPSMHGTGGKPGCSASRP